MRYIIDHDFHIHSGGSMCSGDPNQTPDRILQYAVDEGFAAVTLTDHFWDETVPMPKGGWGPDFYTSQNYPHISKNLPLPTHEGVRFLFGAEVDMTLDGTVGISVERLATMDFALISISHFHCTDFTIRAEDAATPQGRAQVLLDKLELLLTYDLPWHKIGLAHLTGPKLGCGDPDFHCEVLRLLKGDRLTALFKKAAQLGVAIELNTGTFRYGNEAEEQAVVDFYAHAKECGCKFCFGSDAHTADGFTYHRERGQRMADSLGLTEADIFRV